MLEHVSLLAIALSFGLAGCKATSTEPTSDAPTTPVPVSDTPAPAQEPPTESPHPPADEPPRGCTTDADCGDGVCEGEGCGDGEGRCEPRDRMCTRDLQPYCGCDGVTFRSSGSCPGARFRHRGACESAP